MMFSRKVEINLIINKKKMYRLNINSKAPASPNHPKSLAAQNQEHVRVTNRCINHQSLNPED